MVRQRQPSGADRGGEALGHRARVDDHIRAERLQGAHRITVVAELAVVIVLDDHRAGAAGPVDDLHAAGRRQRHTGREVVARREQDRRRAAALELVDDHALAVHRDGDHAGAAPFDGSPVERQPVALHGEHVADDGARQEFQGRLHRGAQDDPVCGGADPARAAEVSGKGEAEFRTPLRMRRREGVVRAVGEDAPGRPDPVRAREHPRARLSEREVVLDAECRCGGGGLDGRGVPAGVRVGGALGDPGGRPLAGGQPALRHQLLVDRRHRAPGHSQVGGQRAVRRQRGARRQPAVADRRPQRLGECSAQCRRTTACAGVREGWIEEQIRSETGGHLAPRIAGPGGGGIGARQIDTVFCHRIGPLSCANRALA